MVKMKTVVIKNSNTMKLLQTAPSCAPSSAEGEEIDNEQHVTVKIRKKVKVKLSETADDPISRRLQLVESINRFNKSKYLRRTITRDKSVPNFDDELLHQLAIKRFDKTKLKPIDQRLDQSKAKIDAESSGESVKHDDVIDALLRRKLMHRRHTVSVALSTAAVSEGSDLSNTGIPSIALAKDCSDDLLSKH